VALKVGSSAHPYLYGLAEANLSGRFCMRETLV
jgi:hypothetical protein